MNVTGLFSGTVNQDAILNKGFDGLKQYKEYVQYVTINFGLGGFYTFRSPREVLEGYTDPFLELIKSKPVYRGGDLTVEPFLSLNNLRTNGTRVTMLTGAADYEQTA